jgi:hypothetical protein
MMPNVANFVSDSEIVNRDYLGVYIQVADTRGGGSGRPLPAAGPGARTGTLTAAASNRHPDQQK